MLCRNVPQSAIKFLAYESLASLALRGQQLREQRPGDEPRGAQGGEGDGQHAALSVSAPSAPRSPRLAWGEPARTDLCWLS